MVLCSPRRGTAHVREVASQRGHPTDTGTWCHLGQPAGADVLQSKGKVFGWMVLRLLVAFIGLRLEGKACKEGSLGWRAGRLEKKLNKSEEAEGEGRWAGQHGLDLLCAEGPWQVCRELL